MEPVRRAQDECAPEAVEFVRFCYHRRHTGWPELYDEMCAVAGRGLYHGWTREDLAERGIGFSLFGMPALAALVRRVVEEEEPRRKTGEASPVRRGGDPLEATHEDQAGETLIVRVPVVPAIA